MSKTPDGERRWRQRLLYPAHLARRVQHFKLSNDPELVAILREIVKLPRW